EEVRQALRAGGGRAGGRLGGRAAGLTGEQRAAPFRAGAVEQRLGVGNVLHERGVEPSAEGGRERELVARRDLQLRAEWPGTARVLGVSGAPVARVVAQELVRRRELAADPRGLPASGVALALGRRERLARPLGAGVRLPAGLPRGLRGALRARQRLALGEEVALETRELLLDLLGAALLDVSELGLELGEAAPVLLGGERLVALRPGRELGELRLDALDPPGEPFGVGPDLLGAQGEAIARRARVVKATRQRVVALGPLGQRPLGLAATPDDLLQRALQPGALGAGPRDGL